MNSTLKDAQAPNHRECLLPSVARTPSVIQVTPAKKITFLKRGDPRFAGVRLAVNQRTFKTFSALMDELSQRMPLSFGVRSVTTPRGLHGLSTLEQLEDGGCYLCSDKKPPKTPNGPSRPQGRSPSGHQSRDLEGQRETPRTSSSRKGPKVPRKIKLIKNGDPRFQGTVVLSHGNTRNLAAFVSKASDVLRFPVKQVYTVSGKKVDSLQSLLRSPSILVCAGNEAFRPPAMNEAGKHGTEVLSGPTSRNKIGSWGPKAQQSVIHSRSTSGSRPRWFSLLSEKPGVSDAPRSLHRAWVGPALDRHPQDTSAQPQPGALVAGDDMEKKVHVNEDGSLSVEMRVRFHLLGDDMLLWSRRLGRASGLTAASGADPGLGEVDDVRCMWEGHPWGFVEPGARGRRPCEAGCDTAFDRSCQPGPRCEIWTNPLYATQDEDPASRSGAGRAQHSCCRGPWSPGAAGGDRSSQDSGSLASSARCFEGSEPDSSCCPRSLEGSVGSVSLHQASAAASQSQAAGEGPGVGPSSEPEGAEPGSQDQCSCLTPGNQGVEGAPSDPSARARSCAEPRERGEQHQGCLGKSRARAPQQKATQGDGSGSPTPSPSSLRNEGLQKCGQVSEHHQARSGSITRLSLALSHPSSWDTEGGSLPLSAYASAQQRSPASAMSSPNVSDLDQVALRGHPGKCCHCRDTCCPLDSPATQQVPRPPDRGGACAHSPALRSERSPSNRRQASRALRPPSSGSLHSQDLPGVSSATITPVSNSDCASSFYRPDAPSAAPSADTCQGEKARATPEPASSLALLVRQAAGGEPRAHRGCCCSQIRTPGKTRVLWGPHSEACWVCSGYCPMPPRGRPCARKRPSSSSSSSSSELRADQGPGGGEQGQGKLQVGRSLPRAVGRTARAARRSSPSAGTGPRGVFRGRSPGGGHRIKEQEEEGSMMPGALPHTSPDAMVREWLDNIPEEPVLMKYEMIDETPSVAGDGLEGPEEDLGDQHSLEGLGELVQARQQPLEGDAGDNPEPMTADAGSRSGDGPPQVAATDGDFDTPLEAGAGEKFAMCCGVTQCELPGRVSASTQIMKALMGSKQGRPSSLPEVSSVVARRLSRSARALITCLARLHLFDEDLGSPGGKARFTNSPRYQELLNISQALWPGYGLDQGQLDSDLWELAPCQALPGLGSHAVTEDFTATSSSGVDVSSGSGGSGEGSGPCAVDCTLVPERVELPLETSYQRPDSRSSENPEDLENHQSNCSTVSSKSQASACASSEEGERDGGEQMLDNNLEPPQMLDENLEPSQVLDDNLESFQVLENNLEPPQVLDDNLESPQVLEDNQESSQVLDNNPESSQVLDDNLESSQVLDDNPESSQVLDDNQESSQVLDDNQESSQVLDDNPESSQVLDDNQESSQVLDDNQESSQVLDDNQESSQVLDDNPESSQVLDDNPESSQVSQVLDDNQESSQVLDDNQESSQVLDDNPESSQVLDDNPESSQVLDDNPESSQVLDDNLESSQVLDDNLESSQVLDDNLESSQVLDDNQESSQVLDDNPESSQVLDDNLESSQVLDDNPKSSQVLDDNQESSQVLDDNPESSQVLDDNPESPQVLDDNPESSQVLDDNPESSQVLDDNPESPQMLDGNPESSQLLEDNPESSQVSDDNQESSQVLDDNLESSQVLDDNKESSQVLDDNLESSQVLDDNPESSQMLDDNLESSQMLDDNLESSQILDNDLEQSVENTMHKEGLTLEEAKEEGENEESQEEDSKEEGPPEEGGVSGEELSGTGSLDGETTRDGQGVQEEEAGRDSTCSGLCPPEKSEEPEPTEAPSQLSDGDTNASESQSGPQLEPGLEKLPMAAVMGQEQGQAKSAQDAGEEGTSLACRGSPDADLIWVSKLLKKMEKAFMAHLTSAVVELRVRWSLQDNRLLDQMVAELEQAVGRRLQASTEKELRKVQSWVERKALGSPRGVLRGQASLQTEQRRRRLQGLRNLSAFSEQTRGRELLSLSLEDAPSLSVALGSQLSWEDEGEEFCPCETCVRKKVVMVSPKDTMGAASAPIKKAFDLQQILQKKKEEFANEEVAPEGIKTKLLQEDPSCTRADQGAEGGLESVSGPGPGVSGEDEEEGCQRLSREEDPDGGEAEAASYQETEGGAASQQEEEKSHTSAVSCLEEAEVEAQGKSEEEGAVDEGSGDEDNLGSVAAGEDDQAPEESDGAEAVETQEAGGEERPESEGGNESEKEDSPPDSRGHSQSGEAPGNSSLDLEGRSTPHPGPGGDTSHQSPDPDTGPSSRASSLGHSSQVSQKDSEDHSSVNRSTEDEPKEDPPAESKAPRMYPESSTSEQEGTPSGLQTPEQGADEGSDLQDKKAAANLTLTKAVGKAEGFDQDDFDF